MVTRLGAREDSPRFRPLQDDTQHPRRSAEDHENHRRRAAEHGRVNHRDGRYMALTRPEGHTLRSAHRHFSFPTAV